MQALKIAVIVMGILIVAGMGLLIYGIATRAGKFAGEEQPAAAGPAPPTAFGEVTATLPEGAEVLETSSDGRRLMVRLGLFGGGERILVFDLNSGAQLGTLTLNRGGSAE